VGNLRSDQRTSQKAGQMDYETLRKSVRREALASMGFASVEDCFREICFRFANVLRSKAFSNQAPGQALDQDQVMYLNALRSLNLKVDKDKGIPTVEAIVERMMS